MTIEILFVTWNRLAFTQAAFEALVANTDWDRVERVAIYDDGSTDGTREWIEERLEDDLPFRAYMVVRNERSPVAAMKHFTHASDCDWFAKIDSDVCVPPGWLGHMLGVVDRNPDVELLGMEAGMTRVAGRDGDDDWDGVYRFEPSTHIGGVGLMRRATIVGKSMRANGRNGFTEFQHIYKPVRGWITPDLPVVLLDRMPHDPWLSLSAEYEEAGWQRPWPKWDPVWMRWAWEWMT